MNDSISALAEKYIPNHTGETFTEDELANLMNFKCSDIVNIANVRTSQRFTVREWLRSCIAKTEHEIDKIHQYYPNYLSAELIDVLERILNCNFHNNMLMILASPNDYRFRDTGDLYFLPYYKLLNELKDIQDKDYN